MSIPGFRSRIPGSLVSLLLFEGTLCRAECAALFSPSAVALSAIVLSPGDAVPKAPRLSGAFHGSDGRCYRHQDRKMVVLDRIA